MSVIRSARAPALAWAASAAAAIFVAAPCVSPVQAQEAPEAETAPADGEIDRPIEEPDAPLYSPFTARYLLDEIRNLRVDVERQRADLIEKQMTREYQIAANATGQAQRAVEFFFYLTSVLTGLFTVLTGAFVFVGWRSLRDVRSRIGEIAEARVDALVRGYSDRLDGIEADVRAKSRRIVEAQREIDLTNEIHSLWLRASQEQTPTGKIAVYDEIMKLRPGDTEAMTYKADAAMQLGEPRWALSLANRALDADPENGHAFYLRACAFAITGAPDEALADLEAAIAITEAYRDEAQRDVAFESLRERDDFRALTIRNEDEGEQS